MTENFRKHDHAKFRKYRVVVSESKASSRPPKAINMESWKNKTVNSAQAWATHIKTMNKQ